MTTEITEAIGKPARSFGSKLKRFMWMIFAFALLAVVGYNLVVYYFTYSDGWRAGSLTKFSNKGFVFKTYEGDMFVRGENDVVTNTSREPFRFSVLKGNKLVIQKLEENQGKDIRVHYKEKMATLFWAGDSEYFVDSVVVQ